MIIIIIIIIIQKRKHHLININGLGPIKVPSENHQPFEQLPNLFPPRLRKWLYPSRASGYQGFLWQRIFQRATAHGASEYIWFPTIGVRFFFPVVLLNPCWVTKNPSKLKHAAFFDTLEERETKTSKQFGFFECACQKEKLWFSVLETFLPCWALG